MTAIDALPGWRFSIAPMMDWTDRHCRAFHRLLTRRARLYTEMVTADAVRFGPRERLIGFDESEHPVALQLGGAEPERLAEAARIGADFGYDEINLNCGCPSDRVQDGRFGACLMREPELVGECVAAMAAAVNIPVTVKCRIGVDEQEPRQALFALVEGIAAAGVAGVIVHARKAWLEGLSPKDNRTVPPLDYPLVYELKRAHPICRLRSTAAFDSVAAANVHLDQLDGVMLGRAAYQNPELLLNVDPLIFGAPAPVADSFEALEAYEPYVARQLEKGDAPRRHDAPYSRLVRRPAGRAAVSAAVVDPRAVRRGRGWRRCARRSPRSAARARRGGVTRERRASLSLQHQPAALDRRTSQPLEEAHAEQALAERAFAGDQRGDVTGDDRSDCDAVEHDLGGARRAVGGDDVDVEVEGARIEPDLGRVFGAQHHRRGAGVEQHRDARRPDRDRHDEFAAQAAVDHHLADARRFVARWETARPSSAG